MQNTNNPTPILLAQANTDPGFKVPGASAGGSASAASAASASASAASASASAAGTPASAAGDAASIEVAPVAGAPVTDTSSRELAIGAGIFLVLLVVFFFVRSAFAQHLVRRRVAPSAAESSAWLLFVGLSFLSAAVVLAIVNASKFLTFAVTGTLMVVGLCALVGALLAGRR